MDGGHLSRDFCWRILAILEQEDRVKKKKKKRRPSQVEWGKSLREAAVMRTKCAHPLRQGLTPLCLEGKAGMK